MIILNQCSYSYIEFESKGDRNLNLLVKGYLNENKTYLRDIVIDLPKFGTWKIQF